MLSISEVRELVALEPGEPVLSAYCRTDPRDPANAATPPGWVVALGNGLREWSELLERRAPREERLAFRRMAAQMPTRARSLDGRERGRSLAWFVTPSGSLDRRHTLQLPLRRDAVAWDERPMISPLVEIADRGEPTGLVLVGAERVRLVSWEQGLVEEPDPSTYELSLGDWRRYQAYAAANPARAQQTATNEAAFTRRVDEWRRRFRAGTAAEVARRLDALGWRRIAIAGERNLATSFAAALPAPVRSRVVTELDLNIVDQPPATVAAQLEPHLETLKRREARRRAEEAIETAKAGGPAALGVDETLGALAESRVEHLILDPFGLALEEAGPQARRVLGEAPPQLLGELAVRSALLGGAGVTLLADEDPSPLDPSGGMVALLRY
jgi:hypothetical protein